MGADQYRALVAPAPGVARRAAAGAPLQAILKAHPSTAVIYENMNYEISGLSRPPLDLSVATEMLATQLLHKIARAASRGSARRDRRARGALGLLGRPSQPERESEGSQAWECAASC